MAPLLDGSDLVAIWTSTEISHKATAVLRGPKVRKVPRRGVAALAEAVRKRCAAAGAWAAKGGCRRAVNLAARPRDPRRTPMPGGIRHESVQLRARFFPDQDSRNTSAGEARNRRYHVWVYSRTGRMFHILRRAFRCRKSARTWAWIRRPGQPFRIWRCYLPDCRLCVFEDAPAVAGDPGSLQPAERS